MTDTRDRRNDYGANDKASRRAIRRNRRLPHRANRHHDHQRLTALAGAPDPAIDEVVEVRLRGRRPKTWRKLPDLPLGEHLERHRRA